MILIQIKNEHVIKILFNSLINGGIGKMLQLAQRRIQRPTHL